MEKKAETPEKNKSRLGRFMKKEFDQQRGIRTVMKNEKCIFK